MVHDHDDIRSSIYAESLELNWVEVPVARNGLEAVRLMLAKQPASVDVHQKPHDLGVFEEHRGSLLQPYRLTSARNRQPTVRAEAASKVMRS